MPIGKKTKCFLAKQQNENPRMRVRGFSIPFNSGGLNHRLVTGYLSLSNHLQMRWQTTPATTVTIKDKMYSITKHPLSLPVTGTVDFSTWYKISHIYVGVTRIAELK